MYYKVVAKREDKLYSAFARRGLTVEYIPGVWVSSPIGPLMVYNSYDKAMQTRECLVTPYDNDRVEVWQVAVKKPFGPRKILLLDTVNKDHVAVVTAFWAGKTSGQPVTSAPNNTVLAEEVKLIVKVS